MIRSARINKFFKIVGLLKSTESFRIICLFILFIFFISWAKSSASTSISLNKLRTNEEISLFLRFWLAERPPAELGRFKLFWLKDRLFPHFFKVEPPKIKEKRWENTDRTWWKWAGAFRVKQDEESSLFSGPGVMEKIFDAPEDSKGRNQEAGKDKAEGEEIVKPEFKNIKEKISVYAFLAWLWLIISVLLYIINEQIKEAERRRQLGL